MQLLLMGLPEAILAQSLEEVRVRADNESVYTKRDTPTVNGEVAEGLIVAVATIVSVNLQTATDAAN